MSSNTHMHLFLENCSSDGNVTPNLAKAGGGFQLYDFMDPSLGQGEHDYPIQAQSEIQNSRNSEGFSPGCLVFTHQHAQVLGHLNIPCGLRHRLTKV